MNTSRVFSGKCGKRYLSSFFLFITFQQSHMGKKQMAIDLYYHPASSPCRAVLLTARAINVEMNLHFVNLNNMEHLTPEFIKMNPQHTVPTLQDDNLVLRESRAIMCYLVEKYGKEDKLYPKDPEKRAIVNQYLYFDMGTLFAPFAEVYYPMIIEYAAYDEIKAVKITEALNFLDQYLNDSEFVAGENLTLADISLAASISTFQAAEIDLSKFENILKWFTNCKKTFPDFENTNQSGALQFAELCEKALQKIKSNIT